MELKNIQLPEISVDVTGNKDHLQKIKTLTLDSIQLNDL